MLYLIITNYYIYIIIYYIKVYKNLANNCYNISLLFLLPLSCMVAPIEKSANKLPFSFSTLSNSTTEPNFKNLLPAMPSEISIGMDNQSGRVLTNNNEVRGRSSLPSIHSYGVLWSLHSISWPNGYGPRRCSCSGKHGKQKFWTVLRDRAGEDTVDWQGGQHTEQHEVSKR